MKIIALQLVSCVLVLHNTASRESLSRLLGNREMEGDTKSARVGKPGERHMTIACVSQSNCTNRLLFTITYKGT